MKTRNISALTVPRLAFFTPGMIKGQRLCPRMIRAFFVGAFAITLLVTTSNVFAFTFTTIDVPGATLTNAIGINARGQIVGAYADAGGAFHGFLLDGGTFTTIDVPGATFSAAFGINNRGQISGFYVDVSGTEHGFLLDKGIFATIDVPGAMSTSALAMNARGQIVGSFTDAGGTVHGFVATP